MGRTLLPRGLNVGGRPKGQKNTMRKLTLKEKLVAINVVEKLQLEHDSLRCLPLAEAVKCHFKDEVTQLDPTDPARKRRVVMEHLVIQYATRLGEWWKKKGAIKLSVLAGNGDRFHIGGQAGMPEYSVFQEAICEHSQLLCLLRFHYFALLYYFTMLSLSSFIMFSLASAFLL